MARGSTLQHLCLLSASVLGTSLWGRSEPAATAATTSNATSPRFACLNPPRLDPTLLPDDVRPFLDQENANCFGWQEFIALNWPVSPSEDGKPDGASAAAKFGAPGEIAPLVWQSYKELRQIFLPGAKEPAPWSAPAELPAECRGLKGVASGKRDFLVLEATDQAGVSAPSWLTAQNGKNVYYEIRVNRDEFEFIRKNRLYDARNQFAAVQPGGAGIRLPAGKTSYGDEGAIEVKAAWLLVDDPRPFLARYKVAEAFIYTPNEPQKCKLSPVALVGLHIAHKTPSAEQWVWATFEHVDNAPSRLDIEGGTLTKAYAFYDGVCASASAPGCRPNRKPECTGTLCEPRSRPVNVVRETPLPDYVARLNEAMRKLIVSANPISVWQYYELVNVMWPASSETVPVGQKVPLSLGGAQPTILANTVLETYLQAGMSRQSCLECHRTATIAPTMLAPAPRWASDYSFIFARACDPTSPAGKCQPDASLQSGSRKATLLPK